jgi:hypothetical protein
MLLDVTPARIPMQDLLWVHMDVQPAQHECTGRLKHVL